MSDISIQQILDDSALLQAWYKVKANNGCGGADGVSPAAFERNLLSRLALLRDEVHYRTYRPRPLRRISIPKKNGGLRPLSIPAIRDRILQTAAVAVIGPVFEAEFESCSYAYRKGRSVKTAVHRIEQFREEGYVWVADIDIESYFDEIDHDLLLREVENLIDDKEILRLISLWLKAEVEEGGRRFRLDRGVPQGSPLSPLLANLYLDKLDEAMLDNALRMVRYSDDFIILCKTRERALKALEFTTEVLESLKLRINSEKTRLTDFRQGFRFLGVDFIRSLALKAQYPATEPRPLSLDFLSALPEKTKEDEKKEEDSNNLQPQPAMALAFAEAGVDREDFPDQAQTQPVMEVAAVATDNEITEDSGHDPLLRTLYLFSNGVVLGKESERFTVKKKGKIIQRVLSAKVDQVMVFGNSQITTQAMQFCISEKIPVFLLSGKGRFYGVIDGFDTDPVLLHRDQFAQSDNVDFCLRLARGFIRGKIANCRIVLQRQRRRREIEGLADDLEALKSTVGKLEEADTMDQLRGLEGAAARCYFRAMARCTPPDWNFSSRTKQPPRDPVNSMLSYGYTLLYYRPP